MTSQLIHPMIEVPCATRQVLSETARILISKNRETVTIPIENYNNNELIGHTLANDIVMREPGYPPFVASVMDGYAIDSKSLEFLRDDSEESTNRWTHCVRKKIFAGDSSLNDDTINNLLLPCFYVTTGAVIPQGYDCVLPFEEVIVSDDGSRIAISSTTSISANQWIRLPGSDIPAGSVVLPAGTFIDAVSVGLLLQSGVRTVEVIQPISVGILSTGNELLDLTNNVPNNEEDMWQNMANGKIPDVNKPVLMSILDSFFCKTRILDFGIARDDDMDNMIEKVRTALSQCEVLITTGGISTGESDIMEKVLVHELKGNLHFGRLNMKPGKPTTFITVPTETGDRLVFAMPGNPASAIVCTHLLVRPCLELIYDSWKHIDITDIGDQNQKINFIVSNALVQPEFQAELTSDLKLDIERPEYHRVTLAKSVNGLLHAKSTGMQRSSRLASMLGAEALLILPRATKGHAVARAGTSYHGLKIVGFKREDRVSMQLSERLSPRNVGEKSKFRIGIIQTVAAGKEKYALSTLPELVQLGLSKPTEIITQEIFVGEAEKLPVFLESLRMKVNVDIFVIVCPIFPGSFKYQVYASKLLRTYLQKIADPMAQMVRRAISSQELPSAALFEIVIGYIDNSFTVFLPSYGIKSGLSSVTTHLRATHFPRGHAAPSQLPDSLTLIVENLYKQHIAC